MLSRPTLSFAGLGGLEDIDTHQLQMQFNKIAEDAKDEQIPSPMSDIGLKVLPSTEASRILEQAMDLTTAAASDTMSYRNNNPGTAAIQTSFDIKKPIVTSLSSLSKSSGSISPNSAMTRGLTTSPVTESLCSTPSPREGHLGERKQQQTEEEANAAIITSALLMEQLTREKRKAFSPLAKPISKIQKTDAIYSTAGRHPPEMLEAAHTLLNLRDEAYVKHQAKQQIAKEQEIANILVNMGTIIRNRDKMASQTAATGMSLPNTRALAGGYVRSNKSKSKTACNVTFSAYKKNNGIAPVRSSGMAGETAGPFDLLNLLGGRGAASDKQRRSEMDYDGNLLQRTLSANLFKRHLYENAGDISDGDTVSNASDDPENNHEFERDPVPALAKPSHRA